jgi:hypothetical protein
VSSRGDSYDNALAETINGLYKAELIHRRAPWNTREAVELATLQWGCTGSTISDCWSRSVTSRRPRLRQTTGGYSPARPPPRPQVKPTSLRAPYVAPGFTRAPVVEEVEVAVVGGGFGGLLSAAKLRQAGIDSFRIIEKAGDFGGTWY